MRVLPFGAVGSLTPARISSFRLTAASTGPSLNEPVQPKRTLPKGLGCAGFLRTSPDPGGNEHECSTDAPAVAFGHGHPVHRPVRLPRRDHRAGTADGLCTEPSPPPDFPAGARCGCDGSAVGEVRTLDRRDGSFRCPESENAALRVQPSRLPLAAA